MNALLEKANKWLTELGIRTEVKENFPVSGQTCIAVNRDDVDSLCGIGVVYEEFLNELRSALNTNKFTWVQKDLTWLYLDTF